MAPRVGGCDLDVYWGACWMRIRTAGPEETPDPVCCERVGTGGGGGFCLEASAAAGLCLLHQSFSVSRVTRLYLPCLRERRVPWIPHQHTGTRMTTFLTRQHTSAHVYTHTCMCLQAYTHTHQHTCLHTSSFFFTHMREQMFTHTFTHMYMFLHTQTFLHIFNKYTSLRTHVDTSTCIYTHTYRFSHPHTHTQIQISTCDI